MTLRRRAKIKPTLLDDLNRLVDPVTRGDPESPLRWTAKSMVKLAAELTAKGHKISARSVAALLKSQNFSLQAMRKTKEGGTSEFRNQQYGGTPPTGSR